MQFEKKNYTIHLIWFFSAFKVLIWDMHVWNKICIRFWDFLSLLSLLVTIYVHGTMWLVCAWEISSFCFMNFWNFSWTNEHLQYKKSTIWSYLHLNIYLPRCPYFPTRWYEKTYLIDLQKLLFLWNSNVLPNTFWSKLSLHELFEYG